MAKSKKKVSKRSLADTEVEAGEQPEVVDAPVKATPKGMTTVRLPLVRKHTATEERRVVLRDPNDGSLIRLSQANKLGAEFDPKLEKSFTTDRADLVKRLVEVHGCEVVA